MKFPSRIGAFALIVAALAAQPVFAADKDPVVAVVNGAEIRASAVTAYQKTLPPQIAMQAPFQALLEIVVNNHLIAEQAKKEKIGNEPEVKAALKQFEQQLMVKTWMNKKLREEITDAAVKAAYDDALKEFKPAEEVHARHILSATEAEAKAIIAELGKGADFAATAQAKSTDPSAKQNGGDLGFFAKDEMVPEFANAAFAMNAGEISKAPVQSQFGWHVIKVEAKRMSEAPTLEQAFPLLREQLAEKAAERIVLDVRSKAKVKKFEQDGTPIVE